MSTIDRRAFLGRGAAAAGTGLMTTVAFERLQARSAPADDNN